VSDAGKPQAVPFLWLAIAACAAVAAPTLIAFNVPPSATFFNQAAAFIGWGGYLILLATCLPARIGPYSREAGALLVALALLACSALAASVFASVPWSLSLSSAGTIVAAVLAVAMAASAQRAGFGEPAFRAFCVGLVVAGVGSTLIGLVQVFAPHAADGTWIATAVVGRATGNVRQPNHLSSLLLWSMVGAVWLGEVKVLDRRIAAVLLVAFVYVVFLSASRTGALGMLTLAGWGYLDRRLSRQSRALLMLTPLIYAAMWGFHAAWGAHGNQVIGAQVRFGKGLDLATNRYDVWSNALSLIASHPWLGVGFGDFNFAWTLTPFPGRPNEFFDHTHNLVLNFIVEMGVPLATLVLALMIYALWQALRNAIDDGRKAGAVRYPVQRAAFVIVFLVAVHSMLEYPLWYAYFLLPASFAFGLCLERAVAGETAPEAHIDKRGNVTRPYVIAAMLLILGGTLAVYDYMRVVVIFAPPAGAGSLEQRIVDGRKSVLFGHHADYAAATVTEHPGAVMAAFRRAPHYLLDSRLLIAWARALDERGETDKARYVAARLKEFRNESADEFFAACGPRAAASAPLPFQCEPPKKTYRFEDFR